MIKQIQQQQNNLTWKLHSRFNLSQSIQVLIPAHSSVFIFHHCETATSEWYTQQIFFFVQFQEAFWTDYVNSHGNTYKNFFFKCYDCSDHLITQLHRGGWMQQSWKLLDLSIYIYFLIFHYFSNAVKKNQIPPCSTRGSRYTSSVPTVIWQLLLCSLMNKVTGEKKAVFWHECCFCVKPTLPEWTCRVWWRESWLCW